MEQLMEQDLESDLKTANEELTSQQADKEYGQVPRPRRGWRLEGGIRARAGGRTASPRWGVAASAEPPHTLRLRVAPR